jgi:hypothetical protein
VPYHFDGDPEEYGAGIWEAVRARGELGYPFFFRVGWLVFITRALPALVVLATAGFVISGGGGLPDVIVGFVAVLGVTLAAFLINGRLVVGLMFRGWDRLFR